MNIEITYIFHNCFIVKLPTKTFLFDYPADEFLNEAQKSAIISKLREQDLYLFSSHNHHDHFNRNLTELAGYARTFTCVLSKDIVKKNRQLCDIPTLYTVEGDHNYVINDFTLDTFRSNDAGVAFLLQLGAVNLYFGGDLANWHWEGLTKNEYRLLVEYFGEVLQKLKNRRIQVAFSNTDPRLPNWAGAAQFIETVKPDLFVPMHTLGEPQVIKDFLRDHPNLESRVFQYGRTGDTIEYKG